ncbi:glycoside hydrolase family 88 protein [Botryobacter ruber]|uniref:glycoside hydrolase family 88 protein n=1 Tax=Botryobacter ruber TaxID=2171629 RepID=UPI000E0C8801|nr:glycoside hydrolase family 88 protein [Botryobacter ruber]
MKLFSKRNGAVLLAAACMLFSACSGNNSTGTTSSENINPAIVTQNLEYCEAQVKKALAVIPSYDSVPRNITPGQQQWNYVTINDWTSGFWPGILWYTYEYSNDNTIKGKAEGFTEALKPILVQNKWDHDLGFMFYCSYGNGYRLTKNPAYKEVLLEAADSLVTLYNPTVGTILSWPGMVQKMNWPHNTIADNMMNLELLFWAAKNGRKDYYDMAVRHAEVTMKNHIRPDNSMYHVAVYDDKTGEFIKGVTHQGYADNTMWARGQTWGIYGFTLCFRETGREDFLETAQKLADRYLERLPEDMVPYWDFDAPNIPNEPKDASAAAITASALLELSTMGDNQQLKDKYRNAAEKMIASLSSDKYQSRGQNNALLLHSTGHWPNKTELDVPIIYADYYYIEALLRLKRLNAGEKVAAL